MGTKYCDHGAYGAGSFSGYISSVASNDNGVAGAVLTVTAVASGMVNIGTQITGAGTTEGTTITGFTSGTQGGVGVYTLAVRPGNAVQAQAVRASSALVGRYANPLITPAVWGVPQEGDGTASTPATASATVSLDLSAATAAAGATITIMGAVLSCVATGAVANQFNAGSGAALVSSLVAAINRTTNTSVVAAQAAGWSTPKLQDAVFARIGSPTTTLDIMTRAGSAQYNTSTVTTSGLTGGTFGPYTFSGGSGGCWGHMINMTAGTIWPSAIGTCAYGMFAGNPIAGFIGNAALGGETVNLRSGKSIYLASTNGYTTGVTGSQNAPVILVIDDSTIWPADGAQPVLYLVLQTTGSNFDVNFFGNSQYSHLKGQKYSASKYSLQLTCASNQGGYMALLCPPGCKLEGIDVYPNLLGAATGARLQISSGVSGAGGVVKDVRLKSTSDLPFLTGGSNLGSYEFVNVEFDATGAAIPYTRLISIVANGGIDLSFTNLKFTGFPETSRLFANGDLLTSTTSVPITMTMCNTTWGSVTGRGPSSASTLASNSRLNRFSCAYQSFGAGDCFFDFPAGMADWDSTTGQPTCNARLINGTAWSFKVILSRAAVTLGRFMPFELPRIVKVNSLATAVRTLTVEMGFESTLAFNKSDVSMVVSYQQADGTMAVVDSFDLGSGALAASTTAWSTDTSASTFVFNPGSISHNKQSLSVTTPTAILTGTEITITVRFHKPVSATTKTIFVDPEVAIA
jgi:hypothetical protein